MMYANTPTPVEVSTVNEPTIPCNNNKVGLCEYLITTRNILLETKAMLEVFKRELITNPDKPNDAGVEPQSIRDEIELIHNLAINIREEVDKIRGEFV